MPRNKTARIEAQINGTSIETESKEVPEVETIKKQQEILSDNKKAAVIETLDGLHVELPHELNIGDVLKRRTFEEIFSTIQLVHFWANKFAGTDVVFPELKVIVNALSTPIVKAQLEALVSRVTGIPVQKLEANITVNGAKAIYNWCFEQFEQNGASKAGK